MSMQHGIILAAHGAGDDSRVNVKVNALAESLQTQLDNTRVVAAFHCGQPGFDEAAAMLRGCNVLVVPIMTSEGYYAQRVLLPRVRETLRGHGGSLNVSRALGTRAQIIEWFVHRVQQQLDEHMIDHCDAEILVIGHGTPRHPNSAATTYRAADAIHARLHVPMHTAFLDQQPMIEDVSESLQKRNVIVVPFMIGGGGHADADIQDRLGLIEPDATSNNEHRFYFTEPLLECEQLTEILHSIISEHSTDTTCRAIIGTRGSALAGYQATRFASAINDTLAIETELKTIDTTGDRDQSRAIAELGINDPFTREINAALVNGEIDLAVHSLKDLPLHDDPRIESVAFLPRGSVHEVLVSRSNLSLHELPAGACVGTCSVRRAMQLRAIRPDLRPVPIRGNVPDRIKSVREGTFDAAILAAAGLERLNLLDAVAEHLSLDDFLPAPGQAAIVVQADATSHWANQLCGIDDPATRHAVIAELTFAQLIDHLDDVVGAAYAHVHNNRITLRVRLIDIHDQHTVDATMQGEDPHALGRAAAEHMLSQNMIAGGAA